MKCPLQAWLLAGVMVAGVSLPLVCTGQTHRENPSAAAEIEATLKQYFSAMSQRDAPKLQQVLEPKVIFVESGREKAKTGFVDTSNPKELLPPAGNDDWNNVSIKDVRIQISASHPSVAMASYKLILSINSEMLAMYEALLKAPPAQLTDDQKSEIAGLIKNKESRLDEFAMLARRDGHWRIVSMSVPK